MSAFSNLLPTYYTENLHICFVCAKRFNIPKTRKAVKKKSHNTEQHFLSINQFAMIILTKPIKNSILMSFALTYFDVLNLNISTT